MAFSYCPYMPVSANVSGKFFCLRVYISRTSFSGCHTKSIIYKKSIKLAFTVPNDNEAVEESEGL